MAGFPFVDVKHGCVGDLDCPGIVERGDVPRYAIPVQPLATVVIVIGL